MTPVNGMDGVIDYPFTDHKSLPMDLYLISKCRFVVGCNSGFSSCLPHSFNTPVLVTNYTAPATTAFWPYSNNLLLFMHALDKQSGKVIDAKDMCHPTNYGMTEARDNTVEFDALGYRWQPNSPEEILDAVKEMLELVETNSFNQPRTPEQELFHQYRLELLDCLWSPEKRQGNWKYSSTRSSESRISASFAARHFRTDNSNHCERSHRD